MQSVPSPLVRRRYSPRERLQELVRNGPQEELEKDALDFARRLCIEGGIPIQAMGISGSLLIGMHTPASDLDLIVYGQQNCWALYAGLRQLLDDGNDSEISRLDERGMETLYADRSAGSSMSLAEFIACEKKKVNQGQFRGRVYFLRFLKSLDEIEEHYSQQQYRPEGHAEVIARIAGDEERIFTPCCYRLESVRWLNGFNGGDLREAISYRGRFSEAARRGEWALIRGKVERVEDSSGEIWHRLLLGNSASDVILTREDP
ncbi:MAG TPA: hypothetical protein VMT46_02530 [Anaerolineaceae bacterium]|nr:hypothetical protein [Anaerolineaceae bacterium]